MTGQGTSLTIDGSIAVLCIDNPPVNALSHAVRVGLLEALDRAENDPSVRALLIYGAGRMFIAGADIREFGKPPVPPLLPDVCARIEASRLAVVASLHGATLGGGLEIALAAHYRICAPDTRMGLPEVNLGLIPGAGGIQRLPRLVGTRKAVDMIAGGRPVPAAEAEQAGLVDRLVDGPALDAGLAYVMELLASKAQPRPTREMPQACGVDWASAIENVQNQSRGQDAPVAAVRAIRAGVCRSFDEGLREERRIFNALLQSDQRKAMVHAFFAERAAGNLPELAGVRAQPVQQVGIVGGGAMGSGIACAALLAGHAVTVIETSSEACAKAEHRIATLVQGAVARGKITRQNADRTLSDALSCRTSFTELSDADLVIEAVIEDMAEKKTVFRQLDRVCKPQTVLASNTSYLDIGEIASATRRPERVIGLHFFSPAHVMKLVEVIVPSRVSPEAVAAAFAFAKRLGKTAVRSGVCDGFIGNRILQRCRAVADQMVLRGADPWQVDAAMEEFGFPMGPYAVADLAGLDIGWANRKRLAALHGTDPEAARFPDMLCTAGHFGRKTGRGYYVYDDKGAALPNRELGDLIAQDRATRQLFRKQYHAEGIQRIYVAAIVNEAAQIIDEGIALRPSDVDVVLMAGYGFPRFRGGPLHWADTQGLDVLREDIRRFSTEIPALGRPARLLERLVLQEQTFGGLNSAATATRALSEPPHGSP